MNEYQNCPKCGSKSVTPTKTPPLGMGTAMAGGLAAAAILFTAGEAAALLMPAAIVGGLWGGYKVEELIFALKCSDCGLIWKP